MNSHNSLNLSDNYPCPLCYRGQLSAMILMETFACDLCQHIFSANLTEQTLQMADTQLPTRWLWQRDKWQRLSQNKTYISWIYIFWAVVFVLIPTSLIATANYLFPPLRGSTLAWFPLFWLISTFIGHLICLVWLLLEYFQFPLGVYVRSHQQR